MLTLMWPAETMAIGNYMDFCVCLFLPKSDDKVMIKLILTYFVIIFVCLCIYLGGYD